MKRVAVLFSGRGSNLQALLRASHEGALGGAIAATVCNVPGAPGIDIARSASVPVEIVLSAGRQREQVDSEITERLRPYAIDLVCLAGYMRILSTGFVSRWAGALLNVHPSLLPAFPGLDAPSQALAHGVKVSGATVHFVDEGVDSGAILVQAAVAVHAEDTVDTLSARILTEEHRIYPLAVRAVLEGRVRMDGRRAHVVAA